MPGLIDLFLETATKGARLAYPYVQAMVQQGLSSTDIQTSLQAMGLGFRRTDLLGMVRAIEEVSSSKPYLQSVSDARNIDPSRLSQPVTNTLRRYSFQTEVRGFSLMTGEDMSVPVTVSSSELLTPGEIKSMAMEAAASFASPGGLSSKDDPNMLIEPQSAVIQSGTDRGF